ncbi:histidine-type phosphatase [Rubellicoccus peritrichatus]|uniref:Uncharacterized protein n=1 Tax=Rubellicoccus peritrichatus TaxID=3080537 RepID=A0AAQ3LED3_9BACT|nr:histidine-type phosphatase [Puniceicoccus sp. CR14]WOO42073.1 hypothetical protein RZN69_03165 [Puniceicoccus sp. CR14]
MKRKILLIALFGALFSLNAKAQLWSGAGGDPNGWKYVSWFGWFWSENEDAGWLYHETLEWMYASSQSQDDIFFWTNDLEWMFSGNGTYPAFYSDSLKKWFLYQTEDISVYSVYPLQWWDFDANLYISRDNLAFQVQPTNPLGNDYTLEKTLVLIRHGQRYPIQNTTNGKQWTMTGELTTTGKMEEQYLGSIFKDKLAALSLTTQNTYITADGNKSATPPSRTVQSAEYFTVGLGLYSTADDVPITSPSESNDPFKGRLYCDNTTANNLVSAAMSSSAWATLESSFTNTYQQRWQTDSGLSTVTFYNSPCNSSTSNDTATSICMYNLADYLQFNWINGDSLPQGFTTQDIVQSWNFFNSTENLIYSHPFVGWWQSKPLLEVFNNALSGKDPMGSGSDNDDVFFLFGGHDGNIWPVVSALGTGLPQNPIFASFVEISVYDKGGDKFVYASYNGNALDLSSISGNSDPCPLATFQQYLTNGPSTTSQ